MHFDSKTPIYIQIADDLRQQILTGALDEGDAVMSTTNYATTYRINPATAAKAFALLTEEGLIEKRRGIGMFVRTGARERLRLSRRADYFSATLEPAIDEARTLGIEVDDVIEYIRAYVKGRSTRQEEQ